MRWIRRLFVLAILAAAVALVVRQLRRSEGPGHEPAWARVKARVAGSDPTPRWVAPVDGDCPPGYPVKANDNSGIYHLPDGRFYDRTIPERCYQTAADAERDGYRAAKA